MEMAKAELQDMKVKSFFWKNKDEKDEKKKDRVDDKLPKASNTQMNFEEVLKYINQCI